MRESQRLAFTPLGASIAPRRTRGSAAASLVHAPTSVDQRPEKCLQTSRAFARLVSGPDG